MENRTGSITVYAGPVGSGLTLQVLSDILMLRFHQIPYQVFAPRCETSVSEMQKLVFDHPMPDIVHPATIAFAHQIPNLLEEKTRYVILIEAHRFDALIGSISLEITTTGVSIIASGHDLNASRQPFEATTALMSVANIVEKLPAACPTCSSEGGTPVLTGTLTQLVLGTNNEPRYEARCRRHWQQTAIRL